MRPLQRAINHPAAKRLYSAQARHNVSGESGHLQKLEAQMTRLPNGVVVASVENYSPITRMAAVFKAGSRYETTDTLGASHCLRVMSSQATKHCTAFGLTRNMDQIGGNYTCSATRDHLFYSVDCLRDYAETAAEYLSYASCQPAFKPWEIGDNQLRLQFDLAVLATNPQAQLGELLHHAAYRTTLGRSLYAPDYRVGRFSPEILQSFVSGACSTGRLAVVGTGIDHAQLVQYAKQYTPAEGQGQADSKAKFTGGEQRVQTDSDIVHAALVTEGAPAGSKEHLALLIAQQMLGSGPVVKYSSNPTSKLAQAAAQVTNNPFAAVCINLAYSDSGMFGFSVLGQHEDMDKVIGAVVSQFRQFTKGGASEADFKKAKAQVVSNIHLAAEDGTTVAHDLAFQALTSDQLQSALDVVKTVEALTLNDVQTIAKKVINGKPAMAAIGDLHKTPHMDELV